MSWKLENYSYHSSILRVNGCVYFVEGDREIVDVIHNEERGSINVLWGDNTEGIYLPSADDYESYLTKEISNSRIRLNTSKKAVEYGEFLINTFARKYEVRDMYYVNGYKVKVYDTIITAKKEGIKYGRIYTGRYSNQLIEIIDITAPRYIKALVSGNVYIHMPNIETDIKQSTIKIEHYKSAIDKYNEKILSYEEAMFNYISDTNAVLK